MGLRRRIERLLNRSDRRRSSSQPRCCQLERQQQQQHDLGAKPQLGRRGPLATSNQQLCHLSKRYGCEIDIVSTSGNHYSSFSTTSSKSSSSASESTNCHRDSIVDAWRSSSNNPRRMHFLRLETGADTSCCVAELSTTSGSSLPSTTSSGNGGSGAAVYEEIVEPLYDRVDSGDTRLSVDDEGGYRYSDGYWRYASLPRRQHRIRPTIPLPAPPLQLQPLPPLNAQQLHYQHHHQQQQRLLPLGCTQIDWRGVKCTSF
ncbi:hypothetical protein BOX15_Mlig017865g1 [Macrostomum lignano]|uniref:Uncharacterized protein n=1 Tax=Macrostomum lignano TaxID=282301 RepID=A0A267E752_9PLAT|nr:hypothetical protein BOX15_Mlig017865g1 [Macrostomum lignano]